MRYRKKGIGTGLLEAAVSQCRSRGWPGPVFAEQHANSARLVPRWFHASFEREGEAGEGVTGGGDGRFRDGGSRDRAIAAVLF